MTMFDWDVLIAALLVQLANIAGWIIRAFWNERQKRNDQKHELARREQELRIRELDARIREQEMSWRTASQGIEAGYDFSHPRGFDFRAPRVAHRKAGIDE